MPARHEPAAPASMTAEIAGLCAVARHDAGSLYGQLLRENVVDVLRGSFPRFCERLGPERVTASADRFVAGHQATRPEFHHIATEFVLFAQARMALEPALLSLLEYEWVLLAVEIDPARIAAPGTADDASAVVALNPTAQFVTLPFDPIADEGADDAPAPARPYAVYRTADHSVVTQALTRDACVLLDRLRAGPRDVFAFVHEAQDDFPEIEVGDWITRGLGDGLLCVSQPENGAFA